MLKKRSEYDNFRIFLMLPTIPLKKNIALLKKHEFSCKKPVFRICTSLNADPDPGFYLNADPNPDPDSRLQILDPDPRPFLPKN